MLDWSFKITLACLIGGSCQVITGCVDSPCRDKVRQEHEEIVAMLNQRMAEKAGYVNIFTAPDCMTKCVIINLKS